MTQRTAVLYARYSSDKQREASIDDQLRVCRDYCKAEGIEVVAEYKDYALSGKTDHRPEFRRMIANAPESDYVVVYMFDRFSRDRYDSASAACASSAPPRRLRTRPRAGCRRACWNCSLSTT